MDENECEAKFINDVKYISHIEIKEEVILPDNINDSDSTLSDNEKSSDVKSEECSICFKYRSMFTILKNHDCQPPGPEENCVFCSEISHWSTCFKNHKESHIFDEEESDPSSDSTASDREENEERCKVCSKYEFMLPLLKSHVCEAEKSIGRKCRDCTEVSHWTICYRNHAESHEATETGFGSAKGAKGAKGNEGNSGESTTSDDDEDGGKVSHRRRRPCSICVKYEVMLTILKENSGCGGLEECDRCEKCEEISLWHNCFENHKKTHGNRETVFEGLEKDLRKNKFDCGICLKLNSVVTDLARRNHLCEDVRSCAVRRELSHWLSCLENHKDSEAKRDSNGARSDAFEEFEPIKKLTVRKNCPICSKFRSAIIGLNGHVCQRRKGKRRCEICSEVFFWSRNLKRHESDHAERRDFPSCADRGKRFSGEKTGNVRERESHRSGSAGFEWDFRAEKLANASSLKQHKIFRCCRNDKPIRFQYKCNVCKKCFSNSSDLKNHRGSHREKLKSYKCGRCFAEFKTEFYLRKHKRIHR